AVTFPRGASISRATSPLRSSRSPCATPSLIVRTAMESVPDESLSGAAAGGMVVLRGFRYHRRLRGGGREVDLHLLLSRVGGAGRSRAGAAGQSRVGRA